MPDELSVLAADLTRRLRRWNRKGWLLPAVGTTGGTTGGSRADAAYAAVQRLADLAAAAERRLPRPVPRASDLALADQLAVLAQDVQLAGDPAAARAAVTELLALRRALGFR